MTGRGPAPPVPKEVLMPDVLTPVALCVFCVLFCVPCLALGGCVVRRYGSTTGRKVVLGLQASLVLCGLGTIMESTGRQGGVAWLASPTFLGYHATALLVALAAFGSCSGGLHWGFRRAALAVRRQPAL
mmetsp:Transcript_96907/g.312906  ORF Transcript_96907/g.312906 Transcript_96907/m.312906 type:complete len:129 (-) Transcript_96907:200-586(-)